MPKGSKPAKKKRAALLDNSGDLSHAAVAAFEHVFNRFDLDKDGALSIAELQAFARTCNDGDAFSDEELEDLRFFEQDANKNLTLKGFLQMYHTQTSARENDTWQDLKALGFDYTLSVPPPNAPAPAPSAAAPAPAPPSNTTAAEQCASSDAFYSEGKHDEALRAALMAVRLDGDCADAHRAAGRAFHALGRVDHAERSWAKANALSAVPATDVSDAAAAPAVEEEEPVVNGNGTNGEVLASTSAPAAEPAAAPAVEEPVVDDLPPLVRDEEAVSQFEEVLEPFALLVKRVNALQESLTRLKGASSDGIRKEVWARAVLDVHASYDAAATSLGDKHAALLTVKPEWLCGTPNEYEAMGDELTKALPNSHAAWGLRGDACMKLPMGSSIASDHYEKAEALAKEAEPQASEAYARKKELAMAKFLSQVGSVSAQTGGFCGVAS